MQLARKLYPEIAVELPRPNWRVSPNARRFDFRRFATVAVLAAAMALVHVYQQALVAQDGLEITRTRSKLQEARDASRRLTVEKMILSSPERLAQIAGEQGLVKPKQINYIVLPAKIRDAERPGPVAGRRPEHPAKLGDGLTGG